MLSIPKAGSGSRRSGLRELLSGSSNALVPTRPLSSPILSKQSIWVILRDSLTLLSTCADWIPPLKSAIEILLGNMEIRAILTEQEQEFQDVASRLAILSKTLADHLQIMRPYQTKIFLEKMERISVAIEEQSALVAKALDHSQRRGLREASHNVSEILNYYRRIGELFQQLTIDTGLSTWSITNEHLVNTLLEGMSPAKLAGYKSGGTNRRCCTKDTRVTILSHLDAWSLDPDAPSIFWMSGMAGTGKTTIAHTFANELDKRKRLGGSFFCTRNTAECQDVGRIIPTIAYQLARYSVHFQAALYPILKADPDIGLQNIMAQFEQLLRAPLLQVKKDIPKGVVVIVDALDECTHIDKQITENVGMVLELLFRFGSDLPLKFFITSRPEPTIRENVTCQPDGLRQVFALHEIELPLVQSDIELYLREELLKVVPATEDQVMRLAQLSGKLFIYAATAVRYIGTGNHTGRLDAVLTHSSKSSKKHEEIDSLYHTILGEALHNKDLEDDEVNQIKAALDMAVCAREPIELGTLGELSAIGDSSQVLTSLQSLRSVLYVSEDENPVVTTLHASFTDYMFDSKRSSEFFCDKTKCENLLAKKCFELMGKHLRFNICRLESSFISDESIQGLDKRFKAIPHWQTLSYSCRYWSDHLREASASTGLYSALTEFLSEHLLFWMEVINLKRWASKGIQELSRTKHWLMANSASPELIKLTEDSRIFLTTFVANHASQSTPHIYLSALPFCPKSSSVSEIYSGRTKGLVEVTGGAMQRRQTIPFATWQIQSEVQSIALSSDGSYLAFGCTDGTLGVKNSYDGANITPPWKGHTNWVMSIAFSPDNHCIVSGSNDRTIRIWSTRDGSPIMDPLKGHTGGVISVAFSPKNTCIASGSKDCTIRLWILAAKQTKEPLVLEGHTGWVCSVAFSSDGAKIVSGSQDRTIRIWNAQTGEPLGTPFTGHAGGIKSVAYSPHDTCIVSGASDNSLRVWNERGVQIADLPKGHTGEVSSLAFSANGAMVVSGACDRAICIWGVQEAAMLAGPFANHSGPVNSVVFSPDSTRIFSGSDDRTIRVWEVPEVALENNVFKGHTREVNSVSFSSDGSKIVSSSDDHTVCIWDSTNGFLIVGPLKGHNKLVTSARFSHNDTRVASGSRDKTVRVWDLLTQNLAFDPLQGHTDEVSSVAFSPDGKYVASGSFDRTIRIWDACDNGNPVLDPLTGHTSIIWAIAYSHDGLRIVSGSHDGTIRIWNAQDGTSFTSHFGHGHGLLMSVSFSPDGAHIAAGSDNHSVCVWNAETGSLVAGPFKGHTDDVTSVTFSPSGKKIISGSVDGTIRICDAKTGDLLVPPLLGHTGGIWSVAISPNGKQIVSGSEDHTIRVWDLEITTSTSLHDVLKGGIVVTEDGWVTAQDSSKIFCVPPGIMHCIPSPYNSLVIGELGPVKIDYENLLFGDRWHQCYTRTDIP